MNALSVWFYRVLASQAVKTNKRPCPTDDCFKAYRIIPEGVNDSKGEKKKHKNI